MPKKLTTEEFIKKSNIVHNNKFDYSLVEYKNNATKVKIICPVHNIFEQRPASHLSGYGCANCVDINESKRRTREEFIILAKNFHNDKYDYSLVEYKNDKTKIKIICPIHKIFEQTPHCHLESGCKKCSNINQTKNTGKFIEESKKMHGDKYDYSLVEYNGAHIKVKIICSIHKIFEQTPNSHLKGHGCSCCIGTNKKTTEEFIKKSAQIHDDKYDYSLVEYKNNKTKVKIICREHNTIIEITPNSHLRGKYSCPLCNNRNHRLNKIKRSNENRLNNYPLAPFFNKKGCDVFDKIMKDENIHIQHATNGGEYYISELGYWLDGYDEMNNIAYEYDEKHHYNRKKQIIKDRNRQNEIENFLGCKFIRIKDL